MSDFAICLARASRSPARMLSELSTASMVISPVRRPARMVRLRYGLANASASSATSAVRSANSTRYRSRRCLIELCVRRSKNISELKGSGVAAVLFQQVQPDGQPHRRRAGQKPWREKAHLHPPLPDGQVLAQPFVERPRRVHQKVVHPRRFAPGPSAPGCASRSYPGIRAWRTPGETSSDDAAFSMSTSSTGSRNFGAISCGSSTWKRITLVAAMPQRLHGVDDDLGRLVEIRNHHHDAAPAQNSSGNG